MTMKVLKYLLKIGELVIPSKLYKQTLKKEKGKLSITKEILKHYLNRENWRKR